MTTASRPRAGDRPRERLRRIIFETDTSAGKAFDVALLVAIVLGVVGVMLESVSWIASRYRASLFAFDWGITVLFTVEYGLRLWCARHPLRYARSFFGMVDLLAIVPAYASLLLPGSQSLLVIRALRLLRLFRVFKLGRYLREANVLLSALRASGPKVLVFIGTVLVLVTILGASMYLIEGADSGFTSIPRSIYWAIVTMTTVGYGDIAPQTVAGQIVAAFAMILGYAIIAVPTGIVSAELVHARPGSPARACAACDSAGHAPEARFCRDCGSRLPPGSAPAR